ncbi:hypothetical protein [Lacinutrix sp. 5H-3-7-4]|uniref:hypothetical protein n=1 Tax=Lacinutrix sp. (strain 5H-3-7-4) TaxID=983544 RepID=UPI00020A3566|nr:hypothetical protein [Lacinutrix sp. 5H-3-7-4]AEH01731.1 hypothetical protein Lacal_1885 [Lacinutrix sp. 5H-3-7-4]
MKTISKLLILAILVNFSSCDNSKNQIEYKFASSPKVLACEMSNSELYNEAIHSFENDIVAFYDKNATNNKFKTYSGFINNLNNGRIRFDVIASKHSLDIAKQLQKESNLWSTKNATTTLNYSHPIVDCISNNIKTQYIKETFNALLTTNSMRKNLILPPLQGITRSIQTDGSLIAFLAFEYYYPNIWNLNPENVKKLEAPKQPKVNFNKTPAKIQNPRVTDKKDSHAGHNHD